MRAKHFVLCAILAILTIVVFTACGGGTKTPVSTPPVKISPLPQRAVLGERIYIPPHTKPGPAVESVKFSSSHVDQAVNEVKSKKLDLYGFGLKVTAAKEIANDKDIKVFRAPASSVSLLLNPAPDPRGLNPFSIAEVRRAMHNLVNREFITQEIYGGFAEPMASHVSPSDPDYVTVAGALFDMSRQHDPEYAKITIASAMKNAGAELVDGKWHYKGKPVRVKFIIRVEDERKDVGDVVRIALERVGFEVHVAYKDFAAAISTVYTSDPKVFEWHLYTEGWGRGAADKYDFANINSMSAPWMGNMPGWQIAGFWQYENEKLDTLGKQLFTGKFTNKDERDEMYRKMTKLALEDSIRIWVATVYTTFPAQTCLTGVTEDLVSGPKSILSLRETYCPGKDTLSVGNLWVWTPSTIWNPVGGFSDVYSVDIWKNMVDPPIITHPFSGLPMPFRAGYEIETAGPGGKLAVAQDAIVWDAKEDKWMSVPPGTMATSKVVFDYSKYFQSRWHHGEKITMDDVVYEIYQAFENAYDPEKNQIEFVLAATRRPILDVFKGFRVLDENRLEVYLDFWHFEEGYIASYANLASLSMPWEILAAMDKLVYEDRMAAYSQSSAARFSVPWLSLVMKKDASLVARVLRQFKDEGFMPKSLVSANPPRLERYGAALRWFNSYGHLIISQGPLMLTRYDPPAQYAELRAFRDEGYPFKPGDWYMGEANLVHFTRIDAPPAKRGETYEVVVELTGPGKVDLRYLMLSNGKVWFEKDAEDLGGGKFRIRHRFDGTPNVVFQLVLLASSDKLALVSQKKVDIIVR